jgi:hypothetical protein
MLLTLIVAQFLIVVYLWPHEIYLTSKLSVLGFSSECYYSEMGMVRRVCYYTPQNDLSMKCFYNHYSMPLYKLPWRYDYVADIMLKYENPKAHHWSRYSGVIDDKLSFVIEDPNQDGVIDSCYVEPTPHTM